MAAQDAPDCQPTAPQSAVQLQTADGVARTGGLEAAARAEQGREGPLIDPNQKNERLVDHACRGSVRRSRRTCQRGMSEHVVFLCIRDTSAQLWLCLMPLAEHLLQLDPVERATRDDDHIQAVRPKAEGAAKCFPDQALGAISRHGIADALRDCNANTCAGRTRERASFIPLEEQEYEMGRRDTPPFGLNPLIFAPLSYALLRAEAAGFGKLAAVRTSAAIGTSPGQGPLLLVGGDGETPATTTPPVFQDFLTAARFVALAEAVGPKPTRVMRLKSSLCHGGRAGSYPRKTD